MTTKQEKTMDGLASNIGLSPVIFPPMLQGFPTIQYYISMTQLGTSCFVGEYHLPTHIKRGNFPVAII